MANTSANKVNGVNSVAQRHIGKIIADQRSGDHTTGITAVQMSLGTKHHQTS